MVIIINHAPEGVLMAYGVLGLTILIPLFMLIRFIDSQFDAIFNLENLIRNHIFPCPRSILIFAMFVKSLGKGSRAGSGLPHGSLLKNISSKSVK